VKLRERDIEIEFSDAIDALVFDQMKPDHPNYHGIGEMHRVDFIEEFEEAIVFVEVKDPANPKAEARGLGKF
jgi:Holliday junction resolvase-like predicted endonuclease